MTYANDMPSVERVARTDAGLAAELRLAVMRLRRRLANERQPDNDLSMNAMAVLGLLFRHGESTVGDLAAQERVQPPSMTRTINALEQLGLVTKSSCKDDGRQVLVNLTDEAVGKVKADRARRDEWLAKQLKTLTPHERDVLRQAAPILHALAHKD